MIVHSSSLKKFSTKLLSFSLTSLRASFTLSFLSLMILNSVFCRNSFISWSWSNSSRVFRMSRLRERAASESLILRFSTSIFLECYSTFCAVIDQLHSLIKVFRKQKKGW